MGASSGAGRPGTSAGRPCRHADRPGRASYFRSIRRAAGFRTLPIVVTDAIRSLWAEPRVPDPPAHPDRDALLVALVWVAAVLESALGPDRTWPVLSAVTVIALAPTLFWRRTHPLATVALTFGTFSVIAVVAIARGREWEGLSVGVYVVVLLYALFRWGAGREMVVGLAIVMVPVALSVPGGTPAGDVVGGTIFLLLVAAVGASVRYQAHARTRGRDQVKAQERELLARELHDTVAHHVSAIAVQAQAGRAVAATRPEAALEALAVIEEEASRTLAEMRAMVTALRRGDEPELAPQRGAADIARLADPTPTPTSTTGADSTTGTGAGAGRPGPRVDVELVGDLSALWPPVDAALYRLAQESITNALRHARHATRVVVRAEGDADEVRLTVSDDGDTGLGTGAGTPGFGLVGMTERAHLLGGTLEAGPRPDGGGWTVRAVLPRSARNGTAS